MFKQSQIVAAFLILIASLSIHAAIYKFYDENGNVIYSDQPGPGAVEIEKRDVQAIKGPRLRPATKLSPPQKKQPFVYKELRITSPEDDATIWDNNGDVNVDITVIPQLRTKLGHKLVLSLDGKQVSEPGTATSFALHGIDRGTHSVSVSIVDKTGKTIMSSNSVTFHLKKQSVILRQKLKKGQ